MYIRTGVGAINFAEVMMRRMPRSKPTLEQQRQLRADSQRAAGKSPDAVTREIYDANPWPVKCPTGQTANEKGLCVDESGGLHHSEEGKLSGPRAGRTNRTGTMTDKYDPASKVDDTPEAEAKYKMQKLFGSPLFLIALAGAAFLFLRKKG